MVANVNVCLELGYQETLRCGGLLLDVEDNEFWMDGEEADKHLGRHSSVVEQLIRNHQRGS